jgi:hypothetical protein
MQLLRQKRGKVGLTDATAQEILRAGQSSDLLGQDFHELPDRVRPSVGQASLENVPDSLIRIQLRGVRRKGDEMKSRRPVQELPHRLAPMGIEIIQEDDQVAADLAQKMTEERRHFFSLDVILIQMAVQRAPITLMTDGNPGNGRDAVMAITMTDDGRSPHGTPRFPHGGDQKEARFVDENDMGRQPRGVFFTFGQTECFHSATAASLRSTTRRSGFWWLQPIWRRSLPT